jgi:hypothetical protein
MNRTDTTWSDLEIPDFLDRKKNGIVSEDPRGKRRADRNGIVWPKKKSAKHWKRLAQQRREDMGVSLKGFTPAKGQ